jgi:P-type Ca2+ transporter type 2C
MDLFLESFEDTTIIVLVVAAVVSLAVGVYEDPTKGWIEGAAILAAVLIVAVVTATNNYNKEMQFRKLNAVKDDVNIVVKRDGKAISVRVKDLVVGDLVELNAGDKIPADGLLVDGSDVTCNESSLTGEPEDIKKGHNGHNDGGETASDLFLLSGTSVSTGFGLMLVTAVGEESRWGKTKAKLAVESADTPLQEKLDVLAGQIGNFGMVTAVLTFVAMLTLWFVKPEWRNPEFTFYEFLLKAFIMGVTIVVVAVPEGLPLAVTLSLAYSTQKMMKDNNLIRVLAACETMGNATNICSDKTGTLTQNRMTVVAGWLAGHYHESLDTLAVSSSAAMSSANKSLLSRDHAALLSEGIAMNSTANLMFDPAIPEPVVVGNKTEGALLSFIDKHFKADYVPLRAKFNAQRGDRLITFSSARKRMSVVLMGPRNSGNNGNSDNSDVKGVCFTKGASEIVLERCVAYSTPDGVQPLTAELRREIENSIQTMAKQALRTVAVAHRLLRTEAELQTSMDIEQELVLDAVLGIKDPLRPDVTEAVRRCQEAGITVRMVTGDNVDTAKAIALECGILTEGGLAMEGPDFRRLSPAQLDAVLPRLQVLARSSPDDKHILVTRLNGHALPGNQEEWEVLHPDNDWATERGLVLPGYAEEWKASRVDGQGEVVGVTGDGTNDGPAMKAADVGLSMGLSGTEGMYYVVPTLLIDPFSNSFYIKLFISTIFLS